MDMLHMTCDDTMIEYAFASPCLVVCCKISDAMFFAVEIDAAKDDKNADLQGRKKMCMRID
jgi:hypothetical protein